MIEGYFQDLIDASSVVKKHKDSIGRIYYSKRSKKLRKKEVEEKIRKGFLVEINEELIFNSAQIAKYENQYVLFFLNKNALAINNNKIDYLTLSLMIYESNIKDSLINSVLSKCATTINL